MPPTHRVTVSILQAPQRKQVSAAVLGISGALLSAGLLLTLFFFIFTLRFRSNRIVKMSSPNLNLVTLIGSALTYISAFLFVVQEPNISMETIFQVRISLLYLGVTLVFGPLLGKSWRLHRVFTHRVPDKRVIIKDVTLLSLVAGLLFADTLLLLMWVLSDPVVCARSASASIKAAARGTLYSVTTQDFCASKYSDLWTGLLVGFKAALLIYGGYLAGLTNNISSPPVNQSLAIMIGNGLVMAGTGAVFLVTHFFHDWSNLVYATTSGSILVCTTAINCLIFIPQLLQSRQFEEEQVQSTQMSKYFSSPSKSFRSMYSEEQIYHLLGENTSMRKLLSEKNAIIESLQEQVSNAKEKLMKLIKSECSFETIEVTSLSVLSASTLAIQHHVAPEHMKTIEEPLDSVENADHEAVIKDTQEVDIKHDTKSDAFQSPKDQNIQESEEKPQEGSQCTNKPSGCSVSKQEDMSTSDSRSVSFADIVSKSHHQHPGEASERTHDVLEQLSRKINYVSSEKLQEILQELSIETTCGHHSPKRQRRASHSVNRDPGLVPSEGFRKMCVSLSPYMMRRRRGPVYSQRNQHPSHHFPNALPPQTWCLLNKEARNRCNGVKTTRDERPSPTGEERTAEGNIGHGHHNPSLLTKAMELSVPGREENRSRVDNDIWMTPKYSYASENTHGSIPTGRHSEIQARTVVPLANLRPQTLYTETDSSSSEGTICYCHRPYCDLCFANEYDSSDSSETDSGDQLHGWATQKTPPQLVVNFNEDLTPTFV
uniref:G-protein coupled receptors family 3 profile domain-containing protein n=1 Tax=Xenopus tropicalis TaxID=8364 RepID=A0A1B8Y0H7_XENTR